MLGRRSAAGLLAIGVIVVACGGSDEPPEPIPADPVEGAAPSDSVATDDTAPASDAPDTAAPAATEASEVIDEDQRFPDVIDASATSDGSTWTVSATLSSPYDTPERYADAWRVVGPDGTVYGERILTHDHASEQPFTRSESGIEIPDDVMSVTIEGRDQEFGYGGDTFELELPR